MKTPHTIPQIAVLLLCGLSSFQPTAASAAGPQACYERRLDRLDPAALDFFGRVAIAGDVAVASSHLDDDGAVNSGSVYLFGRDAGGANLWGRTNKLTAPDAAAEDRFGTSVAISGDTLVATSGQDSDLGTFAGSAYVFSRDQGGPDQWGFVRKLLASDGAANDEFSIAAVHGDTIAIGAFGKAGGAGAVYVYRRDAGGPDQWGQVRKVLAADALPGAGFGSRVALHGDVLVVGAIRRDDLGTDSGAAYIFHRDQGGVENWGQVAKLTAIDGAAFDYFGSGLAISGDWVVVGSPGRGQAFPETGGVYLFHRHEGGTDHWGMVKKITPTDMPAGAQFGYWLGFDGDLLVAGAPTDSPNGFLSGAMYVFHRNTGGAGHWGEVRKITPSDGASSDGFGFWVGLSGSTAVVGAQGKSDCGADCGAAYVFELGCDLDTTPPTADAGADQTVRPGTLVLLDGTGSFDDNTSSATLIYSWSLVSWPPGSNAILDGGATATPSFVADVAGSYLVQLFVTDEAGLVSVADQVTCTANLAPTAVVTVNPDPVIVGETAQLDGTSSIDPEFDPLTYSWVITISPPGSAATLVNSETGNPTLIPDLPGDYEVASMVSDFVGPGTPATIQFAAVTSDRFVEIQIINAIRAVARLSPDQVTTRGHKAALGVLLTQALVAHSRGRTGIAVNRLQNAIERTDGCVLRGSPDGSGAERDWITDCAAQTQVYGFLDAASSELTP